MKIPFSPPDMTELEAKEVSETIRSGWITTGPKTKEFERQIADYCHVNKAVCLNSQTACAEMALRLLGIGEENGGSSSDEVIVPAYTYTASASVVCHVGAKLVLIDSQADSLEMDYDVMENAINEHTKAIIPVDLGGIPVIMIGFFQLWRVRNIYSKQPVLYRKQSVELQFVLMRLMHSVQTGMGKWWEA